MAADSSSKIDEVIACFPDDKSASLALKELIDLGVPLSDVYVDWGEQMQPSPIPVEHSSVWSRIHDHFVEPWGSAHHVKHRRVAVTLTELAQDPRVLSILKHHGAEM